MKKLLLLLLILASGRMEAGETLLYNGETVKFSAASAWDTNGSTLAQATVAPYSKPNHLRAVLTIKNGWGAAAYVPSNWNNVDMSKATSLSLAIKSPQAKSVSVSLYDANKATSNRVDVVLTTAYKVMTLPLSGFTGVDLSKIQAVVFSASVGTTTTYKIDIDDLKLIGSDCPPCPQPTPCPTPTPTPTPTPGSWIMGYYVGYQRELLPVNQVNYSILTHLIVGRIRPNANGTIVTDFDIDNVNGPILAKALATGARQAGKKSILMLGGDGEHAGFVAASQPAIRPSFVKNLLATMDNFGFDGIDIDWEPLQTADFPNFKALVMELRAARPSMIITVPVGWTNANSALTDTIYKEVSPYVDRLNMMSYSMADAWDGWLSWHSSALKGHTSTTPSSIEASVANYIAIGVPKEKLGIGIGFYGSCWTGSVTGPRQTIGSSRMVASDNEMSYTNIMSTYYTTTGYRYDSVSQVPYLSYSGGYGPKACSFISYEDETSASVKGKYVRDNGLGGVIIWTINQGNMPNAPSNKQPLLKALYDGAISTPL